MTGRHPGRRFEHAEDLREGDNVHCGGQWRYVDAVEPRDHTVYVRFINGESTVYTRRLPVWTEREPA